jgi:hypothetical protein
MRAERRAVPAPLPACCELYRVICLREICNRRGNRLFLRTILRKKPVKVVAIAQVEFLAEKQILQER